jgi:flagellar export protein FliJ
MRRALTRLLRLRELEEESKCLELEGAVAERTKVERILQGVMQRKATGRRDFAEGIESADRVRRADGLRALSDAHRQVQGLASLLSGAEDEVERVKRQLLMQRIARQQVEMLVTEARQVTETETAHRAQQLLDDWYGTRLRQRKKTGPVPAKAKPDPS